MSRPKKLISPSLEDAGRGGQLRRVASPTWVDGLDFKLSIIPSSETQLDNEKVAKCTFIRIV